MSESGPCPTLTLLLKAVVTKIQWHESFQRFPSRSSSIFERALVTAVLGDVCDIFCNDSLGKREGESRRR